MCINERCEGYDLDGLDVEEVQELHGDDEADLYSQWIYFNLK